MKTYDRVPEGEVGAFVQRCIVERAVVIVVTTNDDGKTCTVSVQAE